MKEKIITDFEEFTVGIMGGVVNSYRKKQEKKTGIRVYRDGFIGVAGAIGECDEEKLAVQAEKMLDNKIEYPCDLDGELELSVEGPKLNVKDGDLIRLTEKLLIRLCEECPNFLFSNNVRIRRTKTTYENDNGRKLSHKGETLLVLLIIKDKFSANVFDASFYASVTEYDEDQIVKDVKWLHDNYYKTAEIEEGEYNVITDVGILGGPLSYFEGQSYSTGASLLSGKKGEKIFNEKLSIYFDYAKHPENTPFFDDEGTVLPEYKFHLVKNGVFEGVMATKKVAKMYNLPVSGSGKAAYDTVPSTGVSAYPEVVVEGCDLKEALGEKAIVALMLSGGDYTNVGDYSSPVQMAFLYENGEIKGRIAGDFSISANFYDMLGKNLRGSFKNPWQKSDDTDYIVMKMNVKK